MPPLLTQTDDRPALRLRMSGERRVRVYRDWMRYQIKQR